MEALTIKTFKTSKISAVDIKENRSKDFKYKLIKFSYDGAEVPPIRVDGNFLSLTTRMDPFTLWRQAAQETMNLSLEN